MKPPFKSYSGDDPYIFISYAHKDKADVYPALSALAEKGERIWYDEGIKPGSDWAAEIGIHIDNCALVLWFVSKKSEKRKNVTREIEYAKSRKKPILLIYVENVELTGENAANFAIQQNIYMENCKTYGDLADKVKGLSKEKTPGTNSGEDTSENPGSVSNKEIKLEHKRLRKQRSLRIAGIGGVILVALVLFFTLCFAQIPHVAGMTLDEAVKIIDSSKFNYRETETYSDTVLSGEIISQSPLGGRYGFRFIPIILEVSLGSAPQMTTVPLVVGDEVDFGISKILENMLYFAISAVPTEVKAVGMIDAQDIRAEASVPVETKLGVDVNASSAEEARKIVIDAILQAGGAGLFADADGNPIPDGAFSADIARAVLERIFVIEDGVVVLGDDFDVDDGKIVLTVENAAELLIVKTGTANSDMLSFLESLYQTYEAAGYEAVLEKMRTQEYLDLCSLVSSETDKETPIYYADVNLGCGLYSDYIYIGEYDGSLRSGEGTWLFAHPSDTGYAVFTGMWAEDKPNGEGESLQVIDVSTIERTAGFDYAVEVRISGTFSDGLENGSINMKLSMESGISHIWDITAQNGIYQIIGSSDSGDSVVSYCTECGAAYITFGELHGVPGFTE
jgi:hypothetical protein